MFRPQPPSGPEGPATPLPGRPFRVALLTLAMLGATATGYALNTLWRAGSSDAAWRLVAPKTSASPILQSARLGQKLNLLVAVCDEAYEARGGAKVLGLRGRAEALLLVRLDPIHHEVRAVGIPGATLLGGSPLAALNAQEGVDALRRGVEALTGQKVDRHLVLNTQGAAQILDALGGVSMDLAEAMDYEDRSAAWALHLPAGRRNLRGEEAVGFMRYRGRAQDVKQDLARVQRQQAFLSATLDAFVAPTNWTKAPQLLAIARRNLTTDLPPEEVLGIALWAKDLPREAFMLALFPGAEGRDVRGRWAWLPHLGAGRALAGRMLAEAPYDPPDPASAKVSLLDLALDPSAASDAFNTLVATGWRGAKRVTPSGPQSPLARTRVVVGNGDRALGQAMVVALGLGDLVVDGSGDPNAHITLQLGRDWALRRRDAERPSPSTYPSVEKLPSPNGVLESPLLIDLVSPPATSPTASPRSNARRQVPSSAPRTWSEPSPIAVVGPSPSALPAPSPRPSPRPSPTLRPAAPLPPSPVAPIPEAPSPMDGPREPQAPTIPSVEGEAAPQPIAPAPNP